MRVAVVAESTAHHEGAEGAGVADAADHRSAIATGLTDRGHEVMVFCSQWWGGEERVPRFDHDGVAYCAITYDRDAPDWRFGLRLPRRIRRFDPDVIHAAHDPPLGVVGAGLAGSLTRTPVVVDWDDHDLGEGPPGWARRRAVRSPARVIVPSRLVKTSVLELGRPEETTETIPYSVDMDAIRRLDPEPIADVVCSRRLDADANVESLLLALAELRTVDWSAAVIGDGPEKARYESQAEDLRIDDRVEFLGEQSLEHRLRIFKGAHVAVHTAERAPFAHEFLRALACGCVGIAAYHAGSSAHELIEQRNRGMRVTSEAELTSAIEDAAEFPRKDIDESYESFDEGAILERYLDCYRDVQAEYGLL